EQALRLAIEGPAPTAEEGPLTVTSLRLAFPTTAETWPRWMTPLREEQTEPILHTLEHGTPISSLHPEDLARAVMGALRRERGGAYEAIAVTAAAHSIADDSATRLLGWRPRHVLERSGPWSPASIARGLEPAVDRVPGGAADDADHEDHTEGVRRARSDTAASRKLQQLRVQQAVPAQQGESPAHKGH